MPRCPPPLFGCRCCCSSSYYVKKWIITISKWFLVDYEFCEYLSYVVKFDSGWTYYLLDGYGVFGQNNQNSTGNDDNIEETVYITGRYPVFCYYLGHRWC